MAMTNTERYVAPARACPRYTTPNPHVQQPNSELCLYCRKHIIRVDRPDETGYFFTYSITRTVITEWP